MIEYILGYLIGFLLLSIVRFPLVAAGYAFSESMIGFGVVMILLSIIIEFSIVKGIED